MSIKTCLGLGGITLLSTCACVPIWAEHTQAPPPHTLLTNSPGSNDGLTPGVSLHSMLIPQLHPTDQKTTPVWDTPAPESTGTTPKLQELYSLFYDLREALWGNALNISGIGGQIGLPGKDRLTADPHPDGLRSLNSTFYDMALAQVLDKCSPAGAENLANPRVRISSQQIASKTQRDMCGVGGGDDAGDNGGVGVGGDAADSGGVGSGGDNGGGGCSGDDGTSDSNSNLVISKLFGLVLIPVFAIFGSIGNIMSLRVLSRLRMRNISNLSPVLTALAVSDLLFLLHALFFSFLKYYTLRDPVAGNSLRVVAFPVLGAYSSVVTARITTGLTMMLSVERLVAVYSPIRAKVKCSRSITVATIVIIYTVTTLMFLPYMFKYRAERRSTLHNQTVHVLVKTSLGKDPKFFPVYGTILNTIFRFFPVVLLPVVNILIAIAVRKTWRRRQIISCSRGRGSGTSAGPGGEAWGNEGARHNMRNSCDQTHITLMLLVVSLVSLVCLLPGAVHSIMAHAWAPHYSRTGGQSNLYDIIGNVSYFLETINSSVNFIIYMAFSANFKHTYRRMFCCWQGAYNAPLGASRGSARSVVHFSFRPQNSNANSDRGPTRSSTSSNKESFQLRHSRT
ncbi:FMRFamide receptor [Plakobranchus ocellatus]|uniref:FMRFamide receptor n=1 Tax=Plakobranchus ocellatus TaxID=259542 RepID=A0AAV4AS90_9GAST|nr:FMRFamide receptor [Plakobranchus ocellatus]